MYVCSKIRVPWVFFVPGFEGEKSHLVGAEAANYKSLIVKRKKS